MDWLQIGITVATVDISVVIGWITLKTRLFNAIGRYANEYIASLMQDAIENPEKLAPLLDAITKQGMKSLGVTKEQGMPSMKIGGLKIPGYVVQAFLPLLEGQARKLAGNAAGEVAKDVFG